MAAESRATDDIKAVFSLVNHDGEQVTERSFRGRYLLVFFGFSHCRVVCPRNLGRISVVLGQLGAGADLIQPLYITVDPARDTSGVLKVFLRASYPRFIGLTGTPEEIEAVKQSFRVFAQRKEDPRDPDGYSVPHSAITYLMSPSGLYLDHFTDGVDETQILVRLRALVSKSGAADSAAFRLP
jgi:protein SCO1/2